MNTLVSLVNQPLLERLGWTLVHSVWQGALAAVVLAVMLALVRGSIARYALSCAALVMALGAPGVTYVLLDSSPSAKPQSGQIDVLPLVWASPPVTGLGVDSAPAPQSMDPLRAALPAAGIVWMLGVALLCIRHVGAWVSVQKIRREAVTIEPHAGFHRLVRRLRIRARVRLAESARVAVPSVIGWIRPTIVLPCSALTGLSPMHLDALLAHELAHIRRHDYVVNLIQLAIETLLFYHPAVWWISRQIRQEREHCCDDIAVQVTGDRRQYVEALAAMETLRMSDNSLALASSGGSLLRRVRRLVAPQAQRASVVWPVLLMLGIVFTVAACNQMLSSQVKAQGAGEPTPTTVQTSIDPASPIEAKAAADPSELTVEERMLQRREIEKRQAWQQQLTELEMQLAREQVKYHENHPNLVWLRGQIEATRSKLAELDTPRRTTVPFPEQRGQPQASAYYISGIQGAGPVSISPGGTLPLHSVLEPIADKENLADKHVVIVRARPTKTGRGVELYKAADVLNQKQNVESIRAGDVILVTDQPTPELQAEALGPHVVVEGFFNPKPIPWHAGMTLLQAVVASGINPLDNGELVLSLNRGGSVTGNSQKVRSIIGTSGNTELKPGDRIVISHPEQNR